MEAVSLVQEITTKSSVGLIYAILDIESTGGKYNEEGIMEIAIHRFNGLQVEDKFIGLINPERKIQPFVANLTGINNKMLQSAPKFHEVAKRIIEITDNAVIVAHNAQFDYRILRTEFRRLGYDYKRKTLCTVDLSKKLLPDAESHSLGKLVRSLGIPVTDRHRANGDALATLKLFKLLLTKDSGKTIITEVIREESSGELSHKQLDMVEQLPTETGVYYLYSKKGELLYIGKTKNIKKRVNQHFTNVGDLARKLQKETKEVTFEITGSDVIALLKEQFEKENNRPKLQPDKVKTGFQYGVYLTGGSAGEGFFRVEKNYGQPNRLSSFASKKAAADFAQKINMELRGYSNKTTEEQQNVLQALFLRYSIDGRNAILIDKGRAQGEKGVVLIQKGRFRGYGFTELNHQLNNISILENLITSINGNDYATFIIESVLRRKHRLKVVDLN